MINFVAFSSNLGKLVYGNTFISDKFNFQERFDTRKFEFEHVCSCPKSWLDGRRRDSGQQVIISKNKINKTILNEGFFIYNDMNYVHRP